MSFHINTFSTVYTCHVNILVVSVQQGVWDTLGLRLSKRACQLVATL
jgi:hypothetical protein